MSSNKEDDAKTAATSQLADGFMTFGQLINLDQG